MPHRVKKSSADFPPLLPVQLLWRDWPGTQGDGNSVSMTHPFLGCYEDNQQVVNRWQLSWGADDGGAQPSAYFTRAIQKPFLFRTAGPEIVSKPEKLHLYFLPNPYFNHLPLCHLFRSFFFIIFLAIMRVNQPKHWIIQQGQVSVRDVYVRQRKKQVCFRQGII